ncbi:MAG TPA: hypothetical protein VFG42_22690 [Baekduia sp.]|uniref:hypothetical protein n=1 Tax=Baekduia sp. TaxID=2600305 RepID=UPI002D767090|nr:hypothetical protein [Baekduia sp.]HET6509623.1 hypothetical protein [Baekduia sp.]
MAVLADAVPYTGHTTEHRRIVLDVAGRSVVAVRAGLARYRCRTFGDIGPLVVREAGRARVGADGRFTFRAGEEAQRVTVRGVLRRRTHRITGTVRVVGSIATGQRCASGTLRFTATR